MEGARVDEAKDCPRCGLVNPPSAQLSAGMSSTALARVDRHIKSRYLDAGRYPQALETSRTTVDRLPAVFQARVWHAAAAAQLGLDEEARAAAAAALRLRPNFTISGFLGMIRLSNPRQELNLEEGLRKAGLPV